MSKHRIADYFTDGLNRWALVDNLGLVLLTKNTVNVNINCPIEANANAIIECLFGRFKACEPMMVDDQGGFGSLRGKGEDVLKKRGALEYKVIINENDISIWYETDLVIVCDKLTVLTPGLIYSLFIWANSPRLDMLKKIDMIVNVDKTSGYAKKKPDYFGWVTRKDMERNESLKNYLPITLKETPKATSAKCACTETPSAVSAALSFVSAFIVPPSFSVVPDKPNTQRIPAKENSEAVWDMNRMKEMFDDTWGEMTHHFGKEISAGSVEPTPTDMALIKDVIEDHLKGGMISWDGKGSVLSMYVAVMAQSEFLKKVWDKSYQNKISIIDAFKEVYESHQPAKSKEPVAYRVQIDAYGDTVISSATGTLTIYLKNQALRSTLKELYKLRKLTLIGDNVIGAQTVLGIFDDTELTLENSQLLGNIISLKGRNTFSNAIIEHGAYEDVKLNAKPI